MYFTKRLRYFQVKQIHNITERMLRRQIYLIDPEIMKANSSTGW